MACMEKGKIWLIFGLSVCLFSKSFGFELSGKDSLKKSKLNLNYIQLLTDRWNIGLDIERRVNEFQIVNFKTSGNPLNYQSNNTNVIILSTNYKWLFVRLGLLKFNTEVDKKGATKQFQLGFMLAGRRFITQGLFQNFNGFYLSNANSFLPDYDNQPNNQFIRPDIQNTRLSAGIMYNTNSKRFSYRAAVGGSEIQKKRAGAFLVAMNFTANNVFSSSNKTIISDDFQPFFESNNSQYLNYNRFTKQESITLGLSLGYAYTLVIKQKFFLSAMILPSFASQTGRYKDDLNVTRKYPSSIIQMNEGRVVFGYNYNHHFTSIQFQTVNYTNQIELVPTLNSQYTMFRISYGYRFLPPKLLKRIAR